MRRDLKGLKSSSLQPPSSKIQKLLLDLSALLSLQPLYHSASMSHIITAGPMYWPPCQEGDLRRERTLRGSFLTPAFTLGNALVSRLRGAGIAAVVHEKHGIQ